MQKAMDWLSLQPTRKVELHGRKLGCVYGTITVILFLPSFKTTLWHSMQTDSLHSCNMSMKIFKENVLLSSVRETLCFSMIMQGHIPQDSYWGKILVLGWSVLPHPPYLAHLASSDFYLFLVLNDKKIFSRKSGVNICGKTCWAQNQLNFTWEESTSYLINSKRWF